eukprot:3795866-Pleurochrysis_carterae.AAC.1
MFRTIAPLRVPETEFSKFTEHYWGIPSRNATSGENITTLRRRAGRSRGAADPLPDLILAASACRDGHAH